MGAVNRIDGARMSAEFSARQRPGGCASVRLGAWAECEAWLLWNWC